MATMDDLVRQVQDLEGATTDLLDATNLSKQTLDEAVDSAAGSAGSAKTDAGTASSKAGESVTARNESVKAKDDAKAIVYESEATLTPTPGSIPIADSKAKIDNGWLPFGEVNNPYSGVIGSVDKNSVFWTYQTETFANKLRIRTNAFNINGRFVSLVNNDVTLAEAESTADRAIAFDDVFLDWNGNLDTYRSITPHRTSTGYDADKIAAEHGYSKVSNGLYKTGDSYALLLCRVARRNKGAYHPLWNPEGTVKGRNQNESGIANWYLTGDGGTNVKPITSTELCFDIGGTGHADTRYGIKNGPVYCGRPSSIEYCDAIYATDVTPLYFSAAKVTDRQALLFDSFNKAVAGETFMGAEGTGIGYQYRINTVSYTPNEAGTTNNFIYLYLDTAYDTRTDTTTTISFESCRVNGQRLDILLGALTPTHTTGTCGNNRVKIQVSEDTSAAINVGDTFLVFDTHLYKAEKNTLDSARPQFLACDIIGSLDAMPQEWLDNGIPGNWLAVGEKGEDLIPDGTEKNFKLSRKCLECYLVLYTEDNGNSWINVTSSWKSSLESSANARSWRMPEGYGCLLFYRTAANPFELSANSRPVISVNSSCHATNSAHTSQGKAVYVSNLINKIPSTSGLSEDTRPISGIPILSDKGLYTSLQMYHENFNNLYATDSPCVKTFPLLREVGNAYYLQCIYKEMKNIAAEFGDDNAFNIVPNQSTVTDLNGEEVIVGQKCLKTQFQFDGVTL